MSSQFEVKRLCADRSRGAAGLSAAETICRAAQRVAVRGYGGIAPAVWCFGQHRIPREYLTEREIENLMESAGEGAIGTQPRS